MAESAAVKVSSHVLREGVHEGLALAGVGGAGVAAHENGEGFSSTQPEAAEPFLAAGGAPSGGISGDISGGEVECCDDGCCGCIVDCLVSIWTCFWECICG